jgi:two-component system chemotaxis response regulator CheB
MLDKPVLKVLVVDDSALYRKIVQDILTEIPGVEVLGTAPNGKIALDKTLHLKPDLLILDIEMPEMGGLAVLRHLKKEAADVDAIVLSACMKGDAEITFQALELGAFDFIAKPHIGTLTENRSTLRSAVTAMLEAYQRMRHVKRLLRGSTVSVQNEGLPALSSGRNLQAIHHGRSRKKKKAVAIGVSTGGPVALKKVVPRLPHDLGVPVFIVQHMPALFTGVLARNLDTVSRIKVKEAEDREPVSPGVAYIAPGGKQMRVAGRPDGHAFLRVNEDSAETPYKPSVDVLFRSVMRLYGGDVVGVIMTGMGNDGTDGLRVLKARGAYVIAQDESTSIVYGMPRKPVEAGVVDAILPLDDIAGEIIRSVK